MTGGFEPSASGTWDCKIQQMTFLKYLIEFALMSSFGMLLCSSLTKVALVLSLLAHPVLTCNVSKRLHFHLYSNVLFKGAAGQSPCRHVFFYFGASHTLC